MPVMQVDFQQHRETPMLTRTSISTAVLMLTGATTGLVGMPVAAQQQQLDRVEVTGSAIRRIDAESSLPVQVLRREDIERSGASSATDLLQRLSTVQGSVGETAAVGGDSFGFAGVSLHNLGEQRTLVLLNGHRLALFGGQTLTGFAAGFDLNSIPVTAIERIEILTDGASSLYGSDAISGVVNFITRRDSTLGDVTVGISYPTGGGAKETRISATKGFGSIEENGFNAIVSFSHDKRERLDAKQRDYAKSGNVEFKYRGERYRFQQYSTRSIPGNVVNDNGELISPYLIANGSCPASSFRVTAPFEGENGEALTDDFCGFDFVSTLEIYPVRSRDNFFGSVNKKLGDHELFADVLLSRTEQTSRIAPVPGELTVAAGTPLFEQYLRPIGITQDATVSYRLADLGKRTSDDQADFFDVAVGSKGLLAGWDYTALYAHSESKVKGSISGYPGGLAIQRLLASGALNPFVGPGEQSPAAQQAIAQTAFNGYWNGGTSKLDTAKLFGSREIAALPAGPLVLGTGVSFQIEDFKNAPSLFAQGKVADPVTGRLCDPDALTGPDVCDQRFGDASATTLYGAKRKAAAVFGELVIPALKTLELTASARYDYYSDVDSSATAKGSFRWTPADGVLVRGSLGTGFHAPTVPQIAAPRQPYGVTDGNYTCGAELRQLAADLGAGCRAGNVQYDQVAGGNRNLKPEKSRQATIGLRIEPARDLSLGADLWHVQIRDVFGQITEEEAFANPNRYRSSFTTQRDPVTGQNLIAFLADNQNLGKLFSTGLDFDVVGRLRLPVGDLGSQLQLTYMIREEQQLQANGPYFSAIGNFAEIGSVTFRWKGKWTNSLKVGDWVHTIAVNALSGYRDQLQTVERLDADGNVVAIEDIRLRVRRTFTTDWQTQWNVNNKISLTVGVLNLFNQEPPLSLATSGINKGQQSNYDDRYYDARGRTAYLNASYRF